MSPGTLFCKNETYGTYYRKLLQMDLYSLIHALACFYYLQKCT